MLCTVLLKSCNGAGLHSSEDLDRYADRETKFVVRSPLINSDLSKPVRVLIPERPSRRQITEGPRTLQHPTRRSEPSITRQHGGSQASHSIAEVIDVDDLAKVIGPVGPAVRTILAQRTGRRLASRQHGCDWGKEIPPMKAGREALWLPLNVPAARRPGPALDQLEEAVPRADVPPAVSLNNNGRSRPADAGINDTQEDRSGREPSGIVQFQRTLFG